MKNIQRLIAMTLVFAIFCNVAFADTTFTVNDAGDLGDSNLNTASCDNGFGACTFRAALEQANFTGGTDTINFQGGTTTTVPGSNLTVDSNIIIDSSATNRLVIDGNSGAFGLVFGPNSDNSQIDSVGFNDIDSADSTPAISINAGADGLIIGGTTGNGNIIGLDVSSGDATVDTRNGIGISSAGSNITIRNNNISGNRTYGIKINTGAGLHTITGNTIGLSFGGLVRPNGSDGLAVLGTVNMAGTVIGGNQAGSLNNNISGNTGHGIRIGDSTGAISGSASIMGNFIGSGAIGNTGDGIFVDTDASTLDLTIGTDGNGSNDNTEGNEFQSNAGDCMEIKEADDLIIAGNSIGLTAAGGAVGCGGTGVKIGTATVGPNTLRFGTDNNDENEGNAVGSNSAGGMLVNNATINNIHGNKFGMNNNGDARSNTGGAALKIAASQATTVNIGTATATGFDSSGSNFIGNSPAGYDGALIISNTASGATVKIKANRFGLATNDTTAATNITNGIHLTAPANYTIGTDLDLSNDTYERNIISNSGSNGIYVGNGPLTMAMSGLYVGLALAGFEVTYNAAAGNGTTGAAGEKNGVKIASNSLTTLSVGGSDSAQRNFFAASGEHGLSIVDVGAAIGFTIRNSIFGFGSNLTTARGNTGSAISIAEGGAISLIDNVVGNSSADAISLTGGTSYTITGSKIGTDSTGLVSHTNAGHGLVLNNFTTTTAVIGGITAALGNIFAGSTGTKNGIYIQQLASSAATVSLLGNYIGICANTATGDIATSNLTTCKNTGHGIEALYGALTIGGDNALLDAGTWTIAGANVISNNTLNGVKIGGSNVSSATLYSNIIGLIRALGSSVFDVAAPNVSSGVAVDSSGLATFALGGVGSTTASSKRAVIASSGGNGLELLAMGITGVATITNTFIGTDWLGTTDRGNTGDGINIAPAVAGATVNVGGISTNQGNVISGNTGDGIDVNGSGAVTVNIYQNVIGLAYGALAKLANDAIGIHLRNNSATVTVGNAEITGKNIISGNGSYGIKVTGGNVVIRGNYIGTNVNGTASSTFANGTNEIYAESTGGSISALRIGGSLNTINDLAHLAIYLKDIISWNETNGYLETDNTWSSRSTATTSLGMFQRYVGATLAASGPQACYDYLDNDGDGTADLGDPGCSNSQDTDETNPGGGGGGGGAAAAASNSAAAAAKAEKIAAKEQAAEDKAAQEQAAQLVKEQADKAEAAESAAAEQAAAVVEQAAKDQEAAEKAAIAEKNIRDYIISNKLREGVSSVQESVFGKNVNMDILLNLQQAGEQASVQNDPVAARLELLNEQPRTVEQELIQGSFDKLAEGEVLTVPEEKRVESAIQVVLEEAIGDIFKQAEASGQEAPQISVTLPSGEVKQLDKNTKIVFRLNAAKDEDANTEGENTVFATPSTIFNDNGVAAFVSAQYGGVIGDLLAEDKVFYEGLIGLRDNVKSVEELRPSVPKITSPATDVPPQSVIWLAGPKAGERVTVFAVDRVSENPKDWKTENLGKFKLDETNKAAVDLDLRKIMGNEATKKITLVVQDERGKGSSREMTLSNNIGMTMETVTIKDGDQINSADLVSYDNAFTKVANRIVSLAAAVVKKDEPTTDVKVQSPITARGYADPGSVVFVTWKSVLKTSTVIADASQGYFEVQVPKGLEKGQHTAYIYSYSPQKKTASNFSKAVFNKVL